MIIKGNYNVSFSVIAEHPLMEGATEQTLEYNKNALRAALYHFGLDITKDITEMKQTHRNVYGKVIPDGLMFIGTERKDDIWIGMKRRAARHDK
jgi:hypothetical protein